MNAIFFTGSRRGGSAIHRQLAGRPEVLLALEMGGNNPLIVWDADPAVAARGICDSAFVTTGQRCVCARRLVIPADERGDAIIDALMARIDHLRIGDPRSDPPVFMGTMIDPAAVRTVENQTKDWLGRGAQVIRPFTAMDIGHALVQPGVYDCTGADCGDEEWFAPVLQVIRCKDFNSAIDRANHTAYGLAAGLVDPDIGHWRQFRQQVRAGILYRNRHITGASGQLPFGGWGHSGNHRPAGVTMIDHCLQAQACMHLDDPLPASAFPGCTGDAS